MQKVHVLTLHLHNFKTYIKKWLHFNFRLKVGCILKIEKKNYLYEAKIHIL